MNHDKIFQISRALKPRDFAARAFHVTFAFKKSKLQAIGINKPGVTHPKNLEFNYFDKNTKRNISSEIGVHSELSCLLKLGLEDCSNFTFFNVRVDRNNQINSSRPCCGCFHLYKSLNAKKVFATNALGIFEKIEI